MSDGTLYVLSNDGSLSALRADALNVLPPQADDMTPLPGSTVSAAVYPSATVKDEGSGIDPASVSLLLDGTAVAARRLRPQQEPGLGGHVLPGRGLRPALSDGAHQVVVKATDWRGNAVTQTWGFVMDSKATTASPGG